MEELLFYRLKDWYLKGRELMKKVQRIIYLLFCILPVLSACSMNPASEEKGLDTLAVESEMAITSSNTQVTDFLAKNIDFKSGYETDECYNITPVFLQIIPTMKFLNTIAPLSHLSCIMVKFTVLASVLEASV